MKKLTEGTGLTSISAKPQGEHGEHLLYTTDWKGKTGEQLKPWHVWRIVVSMEHGQMSMVPWAEITHRDKIKSLVNLAEMEEIVFE